MESSLREILSAVVVLLLPGGAILCWLPGGPRAGRDPLRKLADAAALSVAISALLVLWLWLVGARLSGTAVVVLYGICGLAILASFLTRWFRKSLARPNWRMLAWWAGAIVFILLLTGWRLYQARGLALPAWVDSVHHTLVVRKILEWGGLPRDLEPYLPVVLYYHYGFHVLGALFAFLSGSSPAHAVLWFGQVLNAAVALSVYAVADDLFSTIAPTYAGSRLARAGLAAALVGFVFQMPAYYISWGRYTLLAGLVLLGPAIVAANEAVREPAAARSAWIRMALLIAGICLTHYFVLLLLALYMAILGIGVLYRAIRARQWGTLGRMAAWSGLGILLALPWIIWLWQNAGQQAGVEVVSALDSSAEAKKRVADYFVYFSSLIGPRYNHYLLGFAALGALFGLRRKGMWALIAWTALVVFFAMPWGLRVDPFRPDLFAIVFFFPAAILLAELLASAAEALPAVLKRAPTTGQRVFWAALGLPVILILVWGLRQTRGVTNATTIIATPADVAALDWVQANTPPTARFFINSVPWQASYRGVDGGYWLAPYTGRGSLVPPLLYAWGSKESVRQVKDWAVRAQALETCSPDFWAIAREADLSYVYLREGVGKLQPANLAECPRLRLVYQGRGVYIYQILRPD
jgi:hypothetical protein